MIRHPLVRLALFLALVTFAFLNQNGTLARWFGAPAATERRAPAPAPLENASGATPRMKAREVIRIGRKRRRAASSAAAEVERPSPFLSTAYSTIRIAFFAARPSSVTMPI